MIFIQRTENLTKHIFTKRKIRNPSVRLKINTKQLGTKNTVEKPPKSFKMTTIKINNKAYKKLKEKIPKFKLNKQAEHI